MVAYVPRARSGTVRRALASFPAVLLIGARQTGKTTLLQHEFGTTHAYVSLEHPDVRARVLADPVGFLADRPPPLILDEIQYAPALLHHVKDRAGWWCSRWTRCPSRSGSGAPSRPRSTR